MNNQLQPRRKPLRSHEVRRYPLGKLMAKMWLLHEWGEVHPRKGYRPITEYERFMLNRE
jgi:hypothetical protein